MGSANWSVWIALSFALARLFIPLGVALTAGLSISQIAFIVFGGTPAMTNGFLSMMALSFLVAGVGLIVIATSEARWERRHPVITLNG